MKANSISRLSIGIILSVVTLWACSTVPITGRRQLTGLIDDQQVITMSADAYKQVIDSVKISNDAAQTAMIKRVGTRIQKAVEKYLADNGQSALLEGFNWEFNLIDNDTTVNAWAMPGGKVAFYTGIISICQNELGVAVVMGHEVAHAVAKHGQERINTSYAKEVGFSIGAMALGQNPSINEKLLFQSIGLVTDIGFLAFSRKHESEADELGLIFMAIAGYDPSSAPQFWERMSANGSGAPPEFLSTHPSHETRIQRLNAKLPEAMEYYKNSEMK